MSDPPNHPPKGNYVSLRRIGTSVICNDKHSLHIKIQFIQSLLPTPEYIVKELNNLIYNFLWKGKDKATGVSAINNYEGGGIKMVDIESTIKSLRLSWLKRIFGDNSGAWKNYLVEHLLKETGDLVLFNRNYNI